jgi:hypothetical protein
MKVLNSRILPKLIGVFQNSIEQKGDKTFLSPKKYAQAQTIVEKKGFSKKR